MNDRQDFMLAAADVLIELDIPWMLTGSSATNLYALPRFTADADFVVQFSSATISDVAKRLAKGFRLEPQMSFETNTSTIRHVFRHRSEQFSVELFELSNDPHDQSRFHRRRTIAHHGRQFFIPTPEDVIVQKLPWSAMTRGPKDSEDARNVLEEQGHKLDWPYIQKWCGEHGTLHLLEQIQAEIGQER